MCLGWGMGQHTQLTCFKVCTGDGETEGEKQPHTHTFVQHDYTEAASGLSQAQGQMGHFPNYEMDTRINTHTSPVLKTDHQSKAELSVNMLWT